MICGQLDEFEAQGLAVLGAATQRGVEWIRSVTMPRVGRVELGEAGDRGGSMRGLVFRYLAGEAAKARFETHRRFVDLQYIVEGYEIMEWIPRRDLAEDGAYDVEKDVVFYRPAPPSVRLEAGPGFFAIFTPLDAHRGAIELPGRSPNVLKLVVKIPVREFPASSRHESVAIQA